MSDSPQIEPDGYPPTTIGTLTRKRDECRAASTSARALAEQYTALAQQNEARAAQFDDALAALST